MSYMKKVCMCYFGEFAELCPGSQTSYRTRPCEHSLSFGPPTNAVDQADAASPPNS